MTTVSYSTSDLHPDTGVPYFLSPWCELPGVLCDALWDMQGWCEQSWDHAVHQRRLVRASQPAPEPPVRQAAPKSTRRQRRVVAPRWDENNPAAADVSVVDLDALLYASDQAGVA
jgi:hypothetical protein